MFLLKKLTRLPYVQMKIKGMQSIDSIEAYGCGTRKDLVSEEEEINCSNIVKRAKND